MLFNRHAIQTQIRSRAWGLLLIFLAWQGPVPVLHAHGTFLSGNLPSLELAAHLVKDHSDATSAGSTFIDWHWHWVMLDELRTAGSESSRDSSSEKQGATPELQPLVEIQSQVFESGNQTTLDETLWDRGDSWHRQALRRQDLPTSFLMTFGSDRSLPERLSVYRC